MKRLLCIMALVSSNLYASDALDTLLVGKNMRLAIASLNKIMAEMKEKNVKWMDSSWWSSGNYSSTTHYYRCDQACDNVVHRYKNALSDIEHAALCSDLGDGLILGVLLAIIGRHYKNDLKTSGVYLALCSALVTIAKLQTVGPVPYLKIPYLEPIDSWFGNGMQGYLGHFMLIAASGAAALVASNHMIEKIAEKIDALREENEPAVACE